MTENTKYPRSWFDVAKDRGIAIGKPLKEEDGLIEGGEFMRVGVAILNGCPGCGAVVAPGNSYKVSEEDDYAWCAICAGVRDS